MEVFQLKAARAYLDWSQADLAAKMGSSQTQIARIENGITEFTPYMQKLAEDTFLAAGIQMVGSTGIQTVRLCDKCKEAVS